MGRARRPGDPAAVAGEDGAADAGVPGQGVLGHRRRRRVPPGAELFPARLRNRAGVHGGNARSRDRTERHPEAHAGMRTAMERHGWSSLEEFRGIRRDRVVAHSKIRRPDGESYRGGYDAEGYAAARRPSRPRPRADQDNARSAFDRSNGRIRDHDVVELVDARTSPHSPLWNPDLAPTPLVAAHLVHVSHRRALDRHERGDHHLHACLRPDAAGHDVVAGDGHDPARQHHRPGPDGAQRPCRNEVRRLVSGAVPRQLRRARRQRAGDPAGAGRVRVVRHPDLDRRRWRWTR